jgi:hypothetical protein
MRTCCVWPPPPAAKEHGITNLRLAVAFGVMLAVVVGVRLAVVWLASDSGPTRLLVSLAVVAVFVGIPAAYGVRGLVRGNDDDADSS